MRAILVPGSHPCLARLRALLAWVQHCVRLAATITPLCWVLAARKMLMGTSCPIPLLVDVPPPTPTPCSLLACKYLPLSPPLLLSLRSPSAIHSSFLSPEPVLPNRHLHFLTAFRNGGKENTTHWAASTSAPSCRSSSQPRVPPEDRTSQDKLNPPECESLAEQVQIYILGFRSTREELISPSCHTFPPKCHLDPIPILHRTRPDWNSSARLRGNLNLPRPRSLRPTIPPDSLPIDRPFKSLERSTVYGIELFIALVADSPRRPTSRAPDPSKCTQLTRSSKEKDSNII